MFVEHLTVMFTKHLVHQLFFHLKLMFNIVIVDIILYKGYVS